MHSKSASLSEPSSFCTMGETFYLYPLAWWHCIGIKKHVLCNSSDNIILTKDIPKTLPKPSFRITFICYSWALWWISMTLFSSYCDLRAARTWLPCLSIIPCFVWPFLLERKILPHSIIQSSWSAVQGSSSDVFLNAPSSLRCGRRAILLKMPGWSSYICHCCRNERAYNTWSRTSNQSNKIVGDIVFLIPCFLNFL